MNEYRGKIQKDLLDQLELNGSHGQQYTDLVEKYMTMWDMAEALKADFEEHGVKMFSNTGLKLNPSVPEFSRVNNQMLRLLSELGLKPSPKEVVIVDDEEDL